MRLGGRYLEPVESEGHQKQVPGPGSYPHGNDHMSPTKAPSPLGEVEA